MNSPPKILVVEDEWAILKATRVALEAAGYETLGAETGAEGLRLARAHKPPLVLLDVGLPDISGLEVCRQIKADPDLKGTYVIIVSGTQIDAESRATGLDIGADGYIVRPVSNRELVARVQAMLRIQQAEEALRESEERYRTLFQASTDAIFVETLDGRVLDCNETACTMFGYSKAELTSLSVADLTPAEVAQTIPAAVEEMCAKGSIFVETFNKRKDGAVFPCEVSIRLAYLRGEPYALVYVRDITERKHAEEEIHRLLQQSETARHALLSLLEDQKQAEAALQRRTRALELLNQAGQAFSSTLELGQVLTAVLDTVRHLLEVTASSIWMLEPETHELVCRQATGPGREIILGWRLAPGVGIAGWVVQHGESLIVADAMADQRHFEDVDIHTGMSLRSILSVPLRSRQAIVGVLQVADAEANRFDAADLQVLEPLAASAAIAIENAQLFQQAQQEIAERKRAEEALKRRAKQLALINEIGERIAAVMELETVFKRAASLVQENFGYHHVAIFTRDPEQGELVMRARAGSFAHLFPSEHRIRAGEGMVGWAAAYGETLLANNVDLEPRYVNFYPDILPTRAELCVPIRVGDAIVGVLDVQSDRRGAFDENDTLALQTLADQIAVAIENARLYQELRRHADDLEQRVQERTAQLQVQYARLEAILDSTSDGIIVTDSQGQILLANPIAKAWLGIDVSKGVPTKALTPPEDAKRLQETVRDLAARAAERPEAWLELTGLDLQLNAAPISGAGEDSAAAVVAVHDVSHLKELDRLKSQFVSNVSHELRTPITTIKLYAQLLRRSTPDKWPEYLDALLHEADRQARLVEDVLQVSRMDAGRLEIRPQPVSLNELAQAVVADHRVLAQSKGLELTCRPTERDPTVLVDAERMTQVLNNLVENSIRYTHQGKVEVATGRAEMEGKTWATIRVTDTGIGIPEHELPHIFERFYRGEKVQQASLPGSGLGLAIAKEIVELHGGRITVASQVEVGSTFTVWLPPVEE